MKSNDEKYMRIALGLAKRGIGKTSPNPCVGAVIVKNGRIIAGGFHEKAGEPHAETVALKKAGKRAEDASMYVTLEPCNHFGRTPPCTDSIISAGIKKVIIGSKDPNPINFGKGIKKLSRHGIKTKVGILEQECKNLNEVFEKYATKKIPFVTVKVAQSLDGKIATSNGESRWITGPAARRYVHKLRSQVDAILVGANTIVKDDPLLTSRLAIKTKKQPIKIILDDKLTIPLNAKILGDKSPAPVIVVTTKKAPKTKIKRLEKDASVIIAPEKDGKIDLRSLMKQLAKRQVSCVLVEGGGNTIESFLKAKLVDKILFFIAPKIIGGKNAPTSVEGTGIKSISRALELKHIEFKKVGKDYLIEGYL